MRVAEAMTPEPITVNPRTSVLNARRLLERYQIGHLPVVADGRLVGIVSRRDLQVPEHQVLATISGLDWDLLIGRYRAVETVMRAPALVTRPESSLLEAARFMLDRRIGALPVLDEGVLIGILTMSDCTRSLLDREMEREMDRELRREPATADIGSGSSKGAPSVIVL